ncbi:MAG: flagellar biosynthesis anti-sigma factor FlgM [Oscillospiraceae bacterium]|nr:flagellar biosynthesis anti-sigma factor FlgM [Oscillospiraceae bacterium]
MEIKNLSNRMINAYKSVPKTDAKKSAPSEKTGGVNFDKIEFNVGNSIETAKADIKAAISSNADSARIEKLRAAYAGDSVPESSEKVAETIVG